MLNVAVDTLICCTLDNQVSSGRIAGKIYIYTGIRRGGDLPVMNE